MAIVSQMCLTQPMIKKPMIKLFLIIFVLLSLPFAKLAQAQDSPETLESQAEEMVELLEELSALTQSHRDDCAAMASAIEDFSAQQGERISLLSESLQAVSGELEEKLNKRFSKRLNSAAKAMYPSLVLCAEEPRIDAALAPLSLGTPKSYQEDKDQAAAQSFCKAWVRASKDAAGDCDVLPALLEPLFDEFDVGRLLDSNSAKVREAFAACEEAIEETSKCQGNEDLRRLLIQKLQ